MKNLKKMVTTSLALLTLNSVNADTLEINTSIGKGADLDTINLSINYREQDSEVGVFYYTGLGYENVKGSNKDIKYERNDSTYITGIGYDSSSFEMSVFLGLGVGSKMIDLGTDNVYKIQANLSTGVKFGYEIGDTRFRPTLSFKNSNYTSGEFTTSAALGLDYSF